MQLLSSQLSVPRSLFPKAQISLSLLNAEQLRDTEAYYLLYEKSDRPCIAIAYSLKA